MTSSNRPVFRRKLKGSSDALFIDTDAKCLKLDVNKFVYVTDSFEIEIVTIVDSNMQVIRKMIENTSITELCNTLLEN